jgi:hypothetical protein
MVKLQKHKAYTYKSKSGKDLEHHKFIVTIPQSAIGELGWSEGQQLTYTINGNTLTMESIAETEEDEK